jgi:hypothetical protein
MRKASSAPGRQAAIRVPSGLPLHTIQSVGTRPPVTTLQSSDWYSDAFSIDLDSQKPASHTGFSAPETSKLKPLRSSSHGKPAATAALPITSIDPASGAGESKKLSIVLSKEMHRRAKMQALKEDVTLKDLVMRLIEQHLNQQQTP